MIDLKGQLKFLSFSSPESLGYHILKHVDVIGSLGENTSIADKCDIYIQKALEVIRNANNIVQEVEQFDAFKYVFKIQPDSDNNNNSENASNNLKKMTIVKAELLGELYEFRIATFFEL